MESLSVSSAFAAEGDLLSQTAGGAVSASKATALSQNEMGEVKGGLYTGIGSTYYNANTKAISSPVTTKSSIYAKAFGTYYWGR